MADTTYQPKIYHKRGGDELVAADGGKETIESGGEISLEAGGTLELANSALLSFYSESFTGGEARALFRRMKVLAITNLSTGSTVLSVLGGSSPPVIPSMYGVVIISATATMTNGSMRLYSAKVGQRLVLMFGSETVSVQSVTFLASGAGISGVGLKGSTNTPLSSIRMHASAASYPIITLECFEEGTWTVTTTKGSTITEAAGS